MLKMTATEIARQKKLEAELFEAHAKASAAVKAFNDKVEDAKEFLSSLYGRIEDEVSVRSEKWQESDAALRVAEWAENIAAADPVAIELPEIDELTSNFVALSTAPMED